MLMSFVRVPCGPHHHRPSLSCPRSSQALPAVTNYLEVSLSLFSKLCTSHNRHTQPVVRKYVGVRLPPGSV